MVFSSFIPQQIGIIDYHSPDRNYTRENIGSVSLALTTDPEKVKQSAIYNTNQKYTGIKSEMASAFVRRLIQKEAKEQPEANDLNDTLKELFRVFFPGKTFLGPLPQPDGTLAFPVLTADGAEHDVDELSSGEKAVLYGYLRLRNSAPRGSIILLDEPELHLNPHLTKGLANFYQRFLGEALDNQLWLITHSDTLLREAVESGGIDVFHIEPAHLVGEHDNQLRLVSVQKDVDRVIVDLVGDLAAYRPGQKVVLFEDLENNSFDVSMVKALFPEFEERFNLIAAGKRGSVQAQQSKLRASAIASRLPVKIFAIIDKDLGYDKELDVDQFEWDRYHIENYLLQFDVLSEVVNDLSLDNPMTPERAKFELNQAARQAIDHVASISVDRWANGLFLKKANVRFNTSGSLSARNVSSAVANGAARVEKLSNEELSEQAVQLRIDDLRQRLESDVNSDAWVMSIPGRDLLKRFADAHGTGIGYERFRNLCLSKMQAKEIKPAGMQAVLDKITQL